MLMSEKVRMIAWIANPSLQRISMPYYQSISNGVWLQGNGEWRSSWRESGANNLKKGDWRTIRLNKAVLEDVSLDLMRNPESPIVDLENF